MTQHFDDLIASLEAGQLPEIPSSLAPLVTRAAARPRPTDIQAWAKRLAEDIADAEDG